MGVIKLIRALILEDSALIRKSSWIARGFKPMNTEEMQALRTRYARYAADGRFELYKTSKKYDGSPGREHHGFPPQQQLQS